MAEWMVQYQATPTGYTRTQCLVVEAPTQIDAWIVAYDWLVRRGTTVLTFSAAVFEDDFRVSVEARVGRHYGNTVIYKPTPYDVEINGDVVG